MDSIGESYERFAESMLGRIASLTHIGAKQDFGTDLYCLPRVDVGERMESVTELCLLQVKGGSSPFSFRGTSQRGPAQHEIDWLKSLWAPLYLVRVDESYERVDVFSTWAIWWAVWQDRAPLGITCTWGDSSDTPISVPDPEPTREGGVTTWSVDLGPPFLRLTHAALNDPAFEAKAVTIFRRWIQVDRQTVARFHAWVPLVDAHHAWATNALPVGPLRRLLAWDPQPGRNIDELLRAFVPTLLGLGVHLQWQDNVAAYRLIPALEFVHESGHGDGLIKGLLDGLVANRDAGLTPMGGRPK
jgi:hypothetical protein